MKWPVLFLGALVGCAPSLKSVARDAFTDARPCASVLVDSASEWMGDTKLVEATGCGAHVELVCTHKDRYPGSHRPETYLACDERQRLAFKATDGGVLQTWDDDGPQAAMGTAIASASHDLSCPAVSVSVVGKDSLGYANVLEGCGQRITYQVTGGDVVVPPTTQWTTWPRVRSYVVVARVAIATARQGATAPPPPVAPTTSATTPSPEPTAR